MVIHKYNGGGDLLAPFFISHIKTLNKKFKTCFEWCAGPGYIGRSLLDAGLCENLILADINEESLLYGDEIFPFYDKISYFKTNNLQNIPSSLHRKIDLVVANPPNYFNINPSHHIGKHLQKDLRPNDKGWKIHKDFYYSIKPYLKPNAFLVIHEIQPFEKEVYIESPNIPYDVRKEPPIVTFYDMMKLNKLDLVSITRSKKSLGGFFFTIINN